nr:hypothetical protein [Capnocytophaga canimorsus]
MLFLLPWAVIIPLVFVGYLSYEHLVAWLSSKMPKWATTCQ